MRSSEFRNPAASSWPEDQLSGSVHTILRARTPAAADQVRQVSRSLRESNRAVERVDQLLGDFQSSRRAQQQEMENVRLYTYACLWRFLISCRSKTNPGRLRRLSTLKYINDHRFVVCFVAVSRRMFMLVNVNVGM